MMVKETFLDVDYKVLSEIILIKPFTMDFYSLISCKPLSTSRFTQKCDCFQSHSEIFFIS